jgi:predicted MFS family arabinose efflux permease
MLSRLISCSAAAVLAVLVLAGGVAGFGGEPVLFAAVAVMGIGQALGSPSMQALVHDLVPARDLEAVITLNSISPSLSRAVGPAAGAGLLLLGGPGVAFAATAGANLIFAAVLIVIRPPRISAPEGRPSLLGGFRYLGTDHPTALLLVGVALIAAGGDAILVLAPKLTDNLNDEQLVGVFVGMFGAGSVALTFAFTGLRRVLTLRAATVAGYWALGAGLAATGLLQSRWGTASGYFVAGFGFMLAMVATTTRIQRQIPDYVRGRVLALLSLAFFGMRTISAPISGAIADLTSVKAAFLLAAVVVVGGSLLGRVRDRVIPGPRRASDHTSTL